MPAMTEVPATRPFAKVLLILASALALLIGLWAGRHLLHPPAALPTLTSGTALPAPRPLTTFTLTDHHGQTFDLARLKGAWTLLFFGYTHCPDVCPTTLATLNGMMKKLAEAGPQRVPVHVVFVSVDPQRDTVQRLAEYVPYFNKDFLGVTGTPAQVDAFAAQLNILHMRGSETAPDGGYTVDHTASILLIDPQARFSAIFSAPHVAATIAKDFLSLRNYYEDLQ
jgi:protein SCO1